MGTSVKKCSIKKQSMNDHLQHVYKEEKCVCEVYLKKNNNRKYLNNINSV